MASNFFFLRFNGNRNLSQSPKLNFFKNRQSGMDKLMGGSLAKLSRPMSQRIGAESTGEKESSRSVKSLLLVQMKPKFRK